MLDIVRKVVMDNIWILFYMRKINLNLKCIFDIESYILDSFGCK